MKKIVVFVLILTTIAGYLGYRVYNKAFSSESSFNDESKLIYVPTGSDFEALVNILDRDSIIEDIDNFKWLAEQKKFDKGVKPGCYNIEKSYTINEIINKLRIGDQESVRLTFNNLRTLEELSGKLAKYIEADSISILQNLKDPDVYNKYGFNKNTINTMFIPNTYEVFWNTSAQGIIEKMASEYKSFWNESRKGKAAQLNLSQSEVTILASIVKSETTKSDEAPRVAGVYLNRLRIGMALQADPTLVYALGDFTIKRVLDVHKEIDSPYNTYKYAGLTPGPINFPDVSYIDAVLSAEEHNYFYFCAKPDFSGYHDFSKSYKQHLVYARKYQRELNKRRIYN